MTTPMSMGDFILPDPPERHPDEGSSFTHLFRNGNVYFPVHHFGSPVTTLLGGQLYIVPRPGPPAPHWQSPDLLIAFDVDPELYHRSNGYVISEQGKPPDFVLDVAQAALGKPGLAAFSLRPRPRRTSAVRIPGSVC